jgi:hypothetical protein
MKRTRARAIGVSLVACLGAACQREPAPEPAPPPSEAPAPDRLSSAEALPDAEVAFGLPLPTGMRLVRQFNDSAYFVGEVELAALLEHVQKHVVSRTAQMRGRGAVFARTELAADEQKRQFRIELNPAPRGTELHITDITPAPAEVGLSEVDSWRRAGRNPDGTPIDQNQVY